MRGRNFILDGLNRLKLNCDKTDVITIGTKKQLETTSIKEITVDSCRVIPSECVKNLGCFIDKNLTMSNHVSAICKATFYHLRNIGKILKLLDVKSAQMIVSSLVISRLDYCNSLLAGLPANLLDKLQKVQNQAARIVSLVKKREHITPILMNLHWLPVRERINFKVLCHIFRCQSGSAPEYLQNTIKQYQPQRSLRSEAKSVLEIPKTKTCLGDRAFSVYGPKLWNDLPEYIKTCPTVEAFKRQLKTYLFRQTYS